MDLLTDQEAAGIMRCSPRRVRHLRATRKLTYLPGHPPLIDRADLEEYLYAERLAAVPKAYGPPTREQLGAKASRLAREIWTLRRSMQSRGR